VTVGVLVVDDSRTARRALEHAVESASDFLHVSGSVATSAEALRIVKRSPPGVIAMDVFLGDEDGVELAARIMETRPTPILLVTGADARDPALSFRAMQAGALDLLPKLPAPASREYEHERQRLVRALVALSRVPLVRRRTGVPVAPPLQQPMPDVVVIGASTGGPPLLQKILAGLRPPFPVPIAITQHMATGFVDGLATWLSSTTGHRVVVCEDEQPLEPGVVVIAPADAHLMLASPHRCHVTDAAPRAFHRPSVDELFESAARTTRARTVAVLLSGMGRDGVDGLVKLAEQGAHTIVQDPATAAVPTMPQSAIATGAVRVVLGPAEIAPTIEATVAAGKD
jgi:two-component system chemotaxis response regulator CheB